VASATTRSFVEDAVEQGEKVIVFSCFDEPIPTFARHSVTRR
jgi:hypothetical protein